MRSSLRRAIVASGAWGSLCFASAAHAGSLTRQEALRLAYPGATIERRAVFLTPDQQARASALAAQPIPSQLVARYVATMDGHVVGRAYVDTHVVRTKKESLLISLDAQGRVKRVDVTAFLEPPEYLAKERWLAQYEGHGLDPNLRLDRGIRPMAGATLTAMATNDAVRRVLAIDRVLAETQAGVPQN